MDKVLLLAKELVEKGTQLGYTVATAESLTAGMIAASIADVSGASAVLMGGIVSYDFSVKQTLLGVSVDKEQVVSAQCALEMAEGARRLTKADITVSVTGIAGPDGGTEQTPVGTVFIGCATAIKQWVYEYHFTGDRQAVRQQTVEQALQLILDYWKGGQ